jgi:hypothetical protein
LRWGKGDGSQEAKGNGARGRGNWVPLQRQVALQFRQRMVGTI